MILNILKITAAIGTVLTGLLALLRPKSIYGFTGLSAEGSRGITEIRAVFGGFFIALGIFPLLSQTQIAYRMLGVAYLVVAVIRTISMIVDKSIEKSNFISIVSEILLGIVLVI
jgi:hypothetical protein